MMAVRACHCCEGYVCFVCLDTAANAETANRVVHVPDRRHDCGPNEFGVWLGHEFERCGTVRECGVCRRSWVTYADPRPTSCIHLWRHETRRERRRRMRRSRILVASG